jgi:hypothetical protein
MRKALICLFALACVPVWAQEKKPEPGLAVQVFTLKPGNLNRVVNAARMIAGHNFVSDDGANTVVVKASAEYMPAIEKVVRELDVAPSGHNIEMTFYILQGSREPLAESAPVPSELQSTVAQLKTAFGFQGFGIFDTAVLRLRDGERGEVRGSFAASKYSIQVTPSIAATAKPAAIRLDGFRFFTMDTAHPVTFNASIDVKEGQKVVIGKSGIDGNQSAIILVCISRLVD